MMKQLTFRLRLFLGLGVLTIGALACAGFLFKHFQALKGKALIALSQEKQPVEAIRIIEEKTRILTESIAQSTISRKTQDEFRHSVEAIQRDLADIKTVPSSIDFEDSRKVLRRLDDHADKSQEDLFLHYRNLKAVAFNVYRGGITSRRFDLARNFGILINSLDNTPSGSAEKSVQNLKTRLQQIESFLHSSVPNGEYRAGLLAQIQSLKTESVAYLEVYEELQQLSNKRAEDLKLLSSMFKGHLKILLDEKEDFMNAVQMHTFRAMMALAALFLFSMVWAGGIFWMLRQRLRRVVNSSIKYMANWFNQTGRLSVYEPHKDVLPDADFKNLFQALDVTFQRINSLRKEDLMIRRMVNVPFLLIDRKKYAVFWNTAFTKMAKVRAFEETGKIDTSMLIPTDVIDRCFLEKKQVEELLSIPAGDTKVPVRMTCNPVQGVDGSIEYVLVNIQDLSAHGHIPTIEAKDQVHYLAKAINVLREGGIPEDPIEGATADTLDCIRKLRECALDQQEFSSIVVGQLKTLMFRVMKEGELKSNIHKRMLQVRDEIAVLNAEESSVSSIKVKSAESKAQKLVDIGRASLELQGQIEETFKVIIDLAQKKKSMDQSLKESLA